MFHPCTVLNVPCWVYAAARPVSADTRVRYMGNGMYAMKNVKDSLPAFILFHSAPHEATESPYIYRETYVRSVYLHFLFRSPVRSEFSLIPKMRFTFFTLFAQKLRVEKWKIKMHVAPSA